MIPGEAVEAAARASWELDHDGIAPRYDECSEGTKRQLHREARVVLKAAAPHLMAAAWDQGYEKGLVGAVRIDSGPDVNPYRKDPDAV